MTFVRPEWLWLLLILIPATFFWLKYSAPKTNWQQVIEAELYSAIAGDIKHDQRNNNWILPAIIAITIVALAGPALRSGTVETATQGNLVVILDNSLSMAATDVNPNRITRAKRMVIDWTQSGLFSQSAVIVYSGSAHWLTPFTQDSKTLDVQLTPVDPFIMPLLGSHPEYAFNILSERLTNLPESQLNILWLTDDITAAQVSKIKNLLPDNARKYFAVIGTQKGSAIPLPNDNGFLTDGNQMVIVKVDQNQLYSYGQQLGFTAIKLGEQPSVELLNQDISQKSTISNQQEIGYWLVIPIILLFLLLVKNQTQLMLVLIVFFAVSVPNESYAIELSDWFLNNNQKAQQLIEQKNYDQALTIANSPQVKGIAAYELGDYETAANEFATLDSASGYYNYGNALVQQGKLEEALTAYQNALNIENHENAAANKKLLEEFLQQQAEQNQKRNDQQNSNDSNANQANSNSNQQNGESSQSQSEAAKENQQSEPEESDNTGHNNELSDQNNDEPETSAESENQGDDVFDAEQLRQQQYIESVLNQLQGSPGSVTQRKFKYQYQQNPTQEEGSLW